MLMTDRTTLVLILSIAVAASLCILVVKVCDVKLFYYMLITDGEHIIDIAVSECSDEVGL